MDAVRALWFDGRSSRAREALVRLKPGPRGPSLALQAIGHPGLEIPNDQVGWPEAWSTGRPQRKLVVDLRDNGSLEVEDVGAWQAALAAAGHRPRLAQRMQTRWRVLAGVALLAAAGLFAFYRWGTPWAATQLTRQVPLGWELDLSERAMRDLDGPFLKPSKLPAERQAALRARFDALATQVTPELKRYRGYEPRLQLHFRRGMGANAFALPGGMIVMTDGMVEAAAKHQLTDDALIGVLAHEIGHVMHRHTTRMVVEQGVLNIGLGVALGDVSSVVSIGASALTGLSYRRGHETEADCFAFALMRRANLPTEPMADLLLKVDVSAEGKVAAKDEAPSWSSIFSSHPETPQRARDLKAGHAHGCPA